MKRNDFEFQHSCCQMAIIFRISEETLNRLFRLDEKTETQEEIAKDEISNGKFAETDSDSMF